MSGLLPEESVTGLNVRGYMSSLQEKAKATYDRAYDHAEEKISLAFEQQKEDEQQRRRQSVSRELDDFNRELLHQVGTPNAADADRVIQLLSVHGASVNVKHEDNGWDPLMLACFHGHAACVDALIRHHANVNSSAGKRGSSPLHCACCRGDVSVVQQLILNGADIRARNKDGKSAHDFSVTNSQEAVAQALCEAMIVMQLNHHDVASAGPGLLHAFELAEANTELLRLIQLPAEEHDTAAVVNVINEKGARIECLGGSKQWTPLMLAAYHGYDQTFRQLVQMGASLVHCAGKNQSSAVHAAASGGQIQILQTLLGMKADLFAVNANGQSAQDIAREEGKVEIAAWLDGLSHLMTMQNAGKEQQPEILVVTPPLVPALNMGRSGSGDVGDVDIEQPQETFDDLDSWLTEVAAENKAEEPSIPEDTKPAADPMSSFSGDSSATTAPAAQEPSRLNQPEKIGMSFKPGERPVSHYRNVPNQDLVRKITDTNSMFEEHDKFKNQLPAGAAWPIAPPRQPSSPNGHDYRSDPHHLGGRPERKRDKFKKAVKQMLQPVGVSRKDSVQHADWEQFYEQHKTRIGLMVLVAVLIASAVAVLRYSGRSAAGDSKALSSGLDPTAVPALYTYRLMEGVTSHGSAKTKCEERGGMLATITSPEQNSLVAALCTVKRCWVGLTDEAGEGTWRWHDTTRTSYTNWAPGMPDGDRDENCAYLYGASYPNPTVLGLWNDETCSTQHSYICGWFGAKGDD